MLSELMMLASETSNEKRLELMMKVTDLFINDTQNKSEIELELFGEVFTKLLDCMDEDSKIQISTKFAHVDNTPKAFATALVYEPANIAAPMLEYSNIFEDDDLIDVTNNTSTHHRVAIAKRINVSAVVTDALIEHGEVLVLQTVTDNDTANISPKGFNRIARYCVNDEISLVSLLSREDLPPEIKAILPHLPPETQLKVGRVADRHSITEMQNLVDRTHLEVEIQSFKPSKIKEVNDIRNGVIDLNDIITSYAKAKRFGDIAMIISEIGFMDKAHISKALLQANGEPITVLCRAIELSKSAFEEICYLREYHLSLPPTVRINMLSNYNKMDVALAKRTIKFVKLQASLKNKQH